MAGILLLITMVEDASNALVNLENEYPFLDSKYQGHDFLLGNKIGNCIT